VQEVRTRRTRRDTTPAAILRGLTQKLPTYADIAREAGVSLSLVEKVLAGTRQANPAIREAVERLFEVDVSEVFLDAE
jgi:transcriptional regulator with XRE-family HTH domain